jgi:hypothetical protein
MNFKQELQEIVKNFKSPLLEQVKITLISAAEKGKSSIILYPSFYDQYVISWLKEQDFDVKETDDQIEGCYLTVKW